MPQLPDLCMAWGGFSAQGRPLARLAYSAPRPGGCILLIEAG